MPSGPRLRRPRRTRAAAQRHESGWCWPRWQSAPRWNGCVRNGRDCIVSAGSRWRSPGANGRCALVCWLSSAGSSARSRLLAARGRQRPSCGQTGPGKGRESCFEEYSEPVLLPIPVRLFRPGAAGRTTDGRLFPCACERRGQVPGLLDGESTGAIAQTPAVAVVSRWAVHSSDRCTNTCLPRSRFMRRPSSSGRSAHASLAASATCSAARCDENKWPHGGPQPSMEQGSRSQLACRAAARRVQGGLHSLPKP